jgi:prepilin-type N-terminal cleavage/methylation domain-containing protein
MEFNKKNNNSLSVIPAHVKGRPLRPSYSEARGLPAQRARRHNSGKSRGFTLVEVIVGMGVFTIMATAIYFSFANLLDILIVSDIRSSAINVAENEFETIRNIPYPDIGIQSGIPSGNLIADKIIDYGGASFRVKTIVRDIDDPFDGILGGNPNDTNPADYKLVELEVSCATSCLMSPIKMTSSFAPKNLEKDTKDGSLFIKVSDASGNPVSGANVSILNNFTIPPLNINDTTNNDGELNFVSMATSSVGHSISVTKSGYSLDKTYPEDDPSNPNPIKPDPIIKEQELTQINFSIDFTSSLTLKTQNNMCSPVANIDYQQIGAKLIGLNPEVYKYDMIHQTDTSGESVINNLEWDTYNLINLDDTYEVSGMMPLMPLIVDPASSSEAIWVVKDKNPRSLFITIYDEDDDPVNDANVQIVGPGVDQTKLSARDTFSQTDWSGFQYTSQTGNIEDSNPSGQLTIKFIGGKYATSSEELISSTFDMGTQDITFHNLDWNPISQPPQAGTDSVKLQIATNNDNLTWNFKGPNGNNNTYYNNSGTQVHSSHNGDRYFKYKVFMHTDDDQVTPSLEDISVNFSSSCVPSGQVIFDSLPSGLYNINVTKSGYDPYSDDDISVIDDWQEYDAVLFFPE